MSVLPERWRGPAAARFEETARALAEARGSGEGRARPGWAWGGWGLAAALVVSSLFLDRRDASGRSTVPYGRNTIISTESTGTGTRLEDLSPSPEAVDRSASPEPAVSPPPSSLAPPPSPPPVRRPSALAVALGEPPLLGEEALEPLLEEEPPSAAEPGPHGSPSPAPSPSVLNVGTRLPASLVHPVTTRPGGALVSARVVGDIVRGGRVVVPDGAPLEGVAVATEDDDRVQMVFRALVVEGKTVSMRGVALGVDGASGVAGKVVRKASKGRGGLGRALGVVGRAASLGLIGGNGLAGELAGDVLRSAGRDLEDVGRRWRQSDKVVRLTHGTAFTVYLEGDLEVAVGRP